MSSSFLYFLQLKSKFCDKEFMIWATVSSWSCFCSLHRACPSLAPKNIINLILVLAIWWCLMVCVEYSLLYLEEGICYDQCILLAKLSVNLCPASFHTPLSNLSLLQVSLDFLLLHSSSLWWNGHFFFVLILEGLVDLHRTILFQPLQHYCLGHRLGVLWYWMVCVGNKQKPFCCFWDCNRVLHFRLFCWLWGLLHLFYVILSHSSRYNGHLS